MANYKDFIIFERFHETQLNRYCHYVGLSLIILSMLGILSHLDMHIIKINWVFWLLGLNMIVDFFYYPRFAVPVFLFAVILLFIASQLTLAWNVSLFGIGWLFQLWGHYHEMKPPAFVTHIKHTFIGPRWLVSQAMKFLGKCAPEGWRPESLNPDLNDLIRYFSGLCIPLAAKVSKRQIEKKISNYQTDQLRLKQIYGISEQKVESYNDQTRTRIEKLANKFNDANLIYTSGSTADAKAICYTQSRLKKFKQFTTRSSIQSFATVKASRPSIFILASLQRDKSFTSLVLTKNAAGFSYLWGLKEPSQYLFHPALQHLIRDFGVNPVRLWLMVLCNPAMVYSTNPSTLAVFLKEIDQNWFNLTSLIRVYINNFENLKSSYPMDNVMKVAQKVASNGYHKRLSAIAHSSKPIPLHEMIPGMKCYCCWNGGYVLPFLKQIRQRIPDNIHYIPMFSMSTESIQTEFVLEQGEFCYLPLADEVFYEFSKLDAYNEEESDTILLSPWELKADQEYLMIVSDCYGLIRYNTEDIFLCRKIVHGLPDLIFKRRLGLNYSFTGEKITGEQLLAVYQKLEEINPFLNTGSAQMTLFPSLKAENDLPGYKLIVAYANKAPVNIDTEQLAKDFEKALFSANTEFRDKRESGRLKMTEVIPIHYDELAKLLGKYNQNDDDLAARAWESQFKLIPLNQSLWETVCAN